MQFILIRSALAAALLVASAAASAQAYPARPMTFITGYAAGTGIDTTTRFYADRIREATGQPVIVVNKPGALGNLGAADVARAAPDGYTVLVTPNTPITINRHVMKSMPFNADRDFAPVATVARWGMMLLVNPQRTQVASVAELTALAKSQPGKLNFGSGGQFAAQAAAELYKIRAGIVATHVPYKSAPAALTDLIGGQFDFMFSDLLTGLAQVKAGRLRALAVTTPVRVPAAPDVPTMAEAGMPGYELVSWFGVFQPAGTPAPIVARLSELFNAATRSEAAREFYLKVGGEPFPNTPEATAALVSLDTPRMGELVRAAGIEPQ